MAKPDVATGQGGSVVAEFLYWVLPREYIMAEDPAALTRSAGSDVETKSADAQLAEDIHFSHLPTQGVGEKARDAVAPVVLLFVRPP